MLALHTAEQTGYFMNWDTEEEEEEEEHYTFKATRLLEGCEELLSLWISFFFSFLKLSPEAFRVWFQSNQNSSTDDFNELKTRH